MSVKEKDLVFIKPSNEMYEFAKFLAEKRQLFEYPRYGYGNYDNRGIGRIEAGILGELAFFEYIYRFLETKTKSLKAKDRWKFLKDNAKFCYNIIIGNFDEGFEFKIGDKTIDIKTYENNQVDIEQIFKGLKKQDKPLNLFIDQSQNTKADIYIQCFIMKNNDICLAGYNEGLPPKAYRMPNPAYSKPITELTPIENILKLIKI